MVDIIKQRQDNRMNKINKIIQMLEKAFKKKMKVSKHKLIMEIMLTLTLSRRTALEYIELALYKLNKTFKDLEK